MTAARILIADDHPLFREALKQTLAGGLPRAVIGQAGSLDQVRAHLASAEDCDLVLLDLKMPGAQGLSGLVYLRAQYPNTPVVIVSASEDQGMVHKALDLGAAGFIPKSSGSETIIAAVKGVLAGGVWTPPGLAAGRPRDRAVDDLMRRMASLTAQQIRVLMMLRAGLLNKQIAHELGVSEATVKAHVSAILQKLGVDSRTQAVIAAGKLDVVPEN